MRTERYEHVTSLTWMPPLLVHEFTSIVSNVLKCSTSLKQTKMKDRVTFLVTNSSLRLATTLFGFTFSCVIHDFLLNYITRMLEVSECWTMLLFERMNIPWTSCLRRVRVGYKSHKGESSWTQYNRLSCEPIYVFENLMQNTLSAQWNSNAQSQCEAILPVTKHQWPLSVIMLSVHESLLHR